MAFLASVSQFLGKTFALWVLVFAGLAYISPDSFKFFAPYISPLLGIIMFGIGLTLKASDFSEVFRRPMAVAIGTVIWILLLCFDLSAWWLVLAGLAFYLWYGVEWLVRAVRLKDAGRAYKTVSFEREAYSNEDDPNYIENSNYFAWVKYLF